MQARLILEDGTVFTGKAFGSAVQTSGEVVFHTGVTGLQDMLSNPSNEGLIMTMTQPLIGTVGISRDQVEAIKSYVKGLVVRELQHVPSNWRSDYTLDDILKQHGIPGISDIDTRMLTTRIRNHGTMKGLITTSDLPNEALLEQLRETTLSTDQVKRVSTPNVYHVPGDKEKVVVIDYGLKQALLKPLIDRKCDVVVVPYSTSADQISAMMPDGIILSNGPGNPKDVAGAVETIQQLLPRFPLFGIGLGHQLLALACGADTEKMKHGHRGNNQPIKVISTSKCYITSQNHSYEVKASSLEKTRLQVTHINNNDLSVEGLKHQDYPAFSVQYEPEASPGPLDSLYVFDDFIAMMKEHKLKQQQQPRQAIHYAAYAAAAVEEKGGRQHA